MARRHHRRERRHDSRSTAGALLVPAAIAMCVLGPSAAGAQAVRQLEKRLATTERAAEAHYHELIARKPQGPAEWLEIADWCRTVAGDLTPRSREVFLRRADECMARGRGILLSELDRIFSEARRAVAGGMKADAAAALREATVRRARSSLAEVLPAIREHPDLRSVLDRLDSEISRLDRLVAPIEESAAREKVAAGFVPLPGKWVPAASVSETYRGLKPFGELAKHPDDYSGRLVSTEIITSLRLYELPGLTLLDGFDGNGGYILPNFMPGRLVLTVPPSIRAAIGRSGADHAVRHRVRALLAILPRTEQYTAFFEAEVQHLAVLDEDGGLVTFFTK